ncbi:LIC12162 family protein [bacterium]|nr:LIC12162 family protein [bacterium]
MKFNLNLKTSPSVCFNSIKWDRAEITQALQFLEPQQHVLLTRLTDLLNSYHGLDKSVDYYDVICGEWLMNFSHIVYASYQEVIRGNDFPLQFDTITLPIFADCQDFQYVNVNSSRFNEQLRFLVQKLVMTGKNEVFAFNVESMVYGKANLKTRLKRNILRFVTQLVGGKNAPFVFSRPYFRCSRIHWLKVLKKWSSWARQDDYLYPIHVFAKIDSVWRNVQSQSGPLTSFSDVLWALVPLYIPFIYLEGFVSYSKKAKALDLPRPKVVFTADGLHGHVLFKTLLADWRKEGTKVLNHQHGGAYGIGLIEPSENYEIRIADCFYSAGWMSEDKKVKPLCLQMPNAFYYIKTKGKILLNLLVMPSYVFRIHFAGLPGTTEGMIDNTLDFVRETKFVKNLKIRPYFNDYGWNLMEKLKNASSHVELDDTTLTGPVSYAQSSLVIHNYLGTAWLETLAMNIPTICFFEKEMYAFRPSVQPYIADLYAVGILHNSGHDAAQFVKNIAQDPQVWWQRPDVQKARLAFIKNYANFSTDWEHLWEIELEQWVHQYT